MRIILFRGRPGVGKTTLSNALAQVTHFPILRKDDIYHASAKQVEAHESRNDISYETIYTILEANAKNDVTFILDCPFQYPADMPMMHEWCATHGAELKSVLVTCSDETIWAARIAAREERPFNIHHFTDFARLKEFYGTMQLTPERDELLIDTIKPVGESLEKINAFISYV
jgi:adenylate kinase family enzyme